MYSDGLICMTRWLEIANDIKESKLYDEKKINVHKEKISQENLFINNYNYMQKNSLHWKVNLVLIKEWL